MQILEHQCLYLNDLISYKTVIEKKNLHKLIEHIKHNIYNLQLCIKDNIVFTAIPNGDELSVEVLVPVAGKLHDCCKYNIKSVYKLNNAVVIRHEGCISRIYDTIEYLNQYIQSKGYHSITNPYCRIIRNDTDVDMITDIYIGLNSNIL